MVSSDWLSTLDTLKPSSVEPATNFNFSNMCHDFNEQNMYQAVLMAAKQDEFHDESSIFDISQLPSNLEWVVQTINSSSGNSILEISQTF